MEMLILRYLRVPLILLPPKVEMLLLLWREVPLLAQLPFALVGL